VSKSRRLCLSFGKSRKSRTNSRHSASARLGLGFEPLESRLTLSVNPMLNVVGNQFANEGSQLSITDLGAFTDVVEGGPGGDGTGLNPTDYTPLANSLGAFDPLTNVTFNTDTLAISGGFTGVGTTANANAGFGAYQIAVFAFTDFELDSGVTITATGSRPLALLSLSDLTIAGVIDVSATLDPSFANGERIAGPGGGNGGLGSNLPVFNSGQPAAGAAANSVGNPVTASSGGGPGGGTGGAFGGNGGRAEGQFLSLMGPAGQAYANLAAGIQGGSGGGTAGGGLFIGSGYLAGGGGGGGGIELGAVGTLEVSAGGQIVADGGDGAQGVNFVNVGSGGGGAGGGILLHATNVNQFGHLRANGGNGGTDGEKSGGGGGAGKIMIAYSTTGTFNNAGGTQSAVGGVPWFNGALGGEAGQSSPATIVAESTAAPIIETFNYVINWGDGSFTNGSPTIDIAGVNIGNTVAGSFDGNHSYADNGVYTVTVTINDNGGGTDSEMFSVAVSNVAPVIGSLSTDSPSFGGLAQGQNVTLSALFSDVGALDTHTASIDWGDNVVSGPTVTEIGGSGSVSGSHAYAEGGFYDVTLTLTDDDTGQATAFTTSVIAGVGLHDGVLQIIGTNGADEAEVFKQSSTMLLVEAALGSFSPISLPIASAGVSQIHMYLGGGNDFGFVSQNLTIPATMFGGAGNDALIGGNGNDRLLGEDGWDLLIGRHGYDLLIGGEGVDLIIGDSGSDILISGTTSHDANLVALDAIMAEWTSGHSYLQRVANVTNAATKTADRLNGEHYLIADGAIEDRTVFDDGVTDFLSGGGDKDLFFAGADCGWSSDWILDLQNHEFVEAIADQV